MIQQLQAIILESQDREANIESLFSEQEIPYEKDYLCIAVFQLKRVR